jgi:hypothetical protein
MRRILSYIAVVIGFISRPTQIFAGAIQEHVDADGQPAYMPLATNLAGAAPSFAPEQFSPPMRPSAITYVETYLRDPSAADNNHLRGFIQEGLNVLSSTVSCDEKQQALLILAPLFRDGIAMQALATHPAAIDAIVSIAEANHPTTSKVAMSILANMRQLPQREEKPIEATPYTTHQKDAAHDSEDTHEEDDEEADDEFSDANTYTQNPTEAEISVSYLLYLAYAATREEPIYVILFIVSYPLLRPYVQRLLHYLSSKIDKSLPSEAESPAALTSRERKNRENFEKMRRALATAEQKLKRHEADIDTLRQEKAVHKAMIAQQRHQLTQLEQPHAAEDLARIAALEAQLESLQEQHDALDDTLKKKQTTFTRQGAQIGASRRQIAASEAIVAKQKKTLKDLNATKKQLDATIQGLSKKLSSNEKTMATLRRTIKSQTQRTTKDSTSIAKLEAQLETDRQQQAALKEQCTLLTTDLATSQKQLEQSEAALTDKIKQTALLENKHSTLSKRVSQLEIALADLKAAHQEALVQYQAHIKALKQELAILKLHYKRDTPAVNRYLSAMEKQTLAALKVRQTKVLAILQHCQAALTPYPIEAHIGCNFLPYSDDDYCFKTESSKALFDALTHHFIILQTAGDLEIKESRFNPKADYIHFQIHFTRDSRPCDFVFSLLPDSAITAHTARYGFVINQDEHGTLQASPTKLIRPARRLGTPLVVTCKPLPQSKTLHMLKCLLNETHLQCYGNTDLDNFLMHLQCVYEQFIAAGITFDLYDIPSHAQPGSKLTPFEVQMPWSSQFTRIINMRCQVADRYIQPLYQEMQKQREKIQKFIFALAKQCYDHSVIILKQTESASTACDARSGGSATAKSRLTHRLAPNQPTTRSHQHSATAFGFNRETS